MTTHLLAFVLLGGMAVGDAGAKPTTEKPAQPATVAEFPLEIAARNFRIQTYETFHRDRAEYDRRQAEGTRIQSLWTDAGGSEEDQPKLIRWFDEATACSQADSIGELPSMPEFKVVAKDRPAEKPLVEAGDAKPVRDAEKSHDGRLHVLPAGSESAAHAAPKAKASLIGSLPQKFEAEIDRTLHIFSRKPSPTASSKGN